MATTSPATHRSRTTFTRDLGAAPWLAVVTVVLSSVALALFTPDMVTGSQQEHLPLAALVVWPWTAAAAAYVVMAGRHGGSRLLVVGTSALWVLVAVVSIAAPLMVTGTDPTQIPLAALLAPPAGAIATGFLAIDHAVAGWSHAKRSRSRR